MALSATSKNQLNALLSLLSAKDPELITGVGVAANRLLSSTNKGYVQAILPTDGWSQTPNATALTALNALIADIAAN